MSLIGGNVVSVPTFSFMDPTWVGNVLRPLFPLYNHTQPSYIFKEKKHMWISFMGQPILQWVSRYGGDGLQVNVNFLASWSQSLCMTDKVAREWALPHSEHYPLCEQEEETISHLLSAYVFAQQFRRRHLMGLVFLVLALLMVATSLRQSMHLREAWFQYVVCCALTLLMILLFS